MYAKCSFFLLICAVLCAHGAEQSNTKLNDGETLISTLKDTLKQTSDDAADDQRIEGLYKLYSALQGTVTDIIRRLNASEDFTSAKEKLITRKRRNIGQDLPSNGCTPSSIGCPSGAYTPYFMGQSIMCPPGPAGPQGPPGNEGDRGRDGRDGRDGDRGPKGDDGDCDPTSNVAMNSNQQTSAERPHPSSNYSGAIYVRWGRTECPSTSELVYTGVAGGEYYTHKGGASNYICLPQEPIYDEPEASAHNSRGFVYGVEYQTTYYPPYAHLHDNDVPCAVCKALRRYSHIMVPARNVCPGSEWTLEYSGHLMTDHYTHRRREYICLDRNAEAIPRSVTDVNGGLLYPVEGRCVSSGGIPCGPYVHGYELTCAICTL